MAGETIGQSFDPRRNSLNALRLGLALVVLVAHALALVVFRIPVAINGTGVGEIAVYGFFGLSGFLIAGSAQRNNVGRYLWQRFLRIFPAYWVCLLVTAFVIGVVGWVSDPPIICGLSCYFHAGTNGPFSYLYENALLRMNQAGIAHTPTVGIIPGIWNASTWTLYYEFLCYLVIAGLAMLGILRRRAVVLTLTIGLWAFMALAIFNPALNRSLNWVTNDQLMFLVRFAAVFMVGAAICLYRDKLPDSGWLAGCLLLFAGGLLLPDHAAESEIAFTHTNLLLPTIAYPLIWLGIHLPFERVGARNDYSYGIYIYGFPITQLLVIWGAWRWGALPFVALCVLMTAVLAAGSWWLVEKHALRLKRVGRRAPEMVPAAAAP